MLVFRDDSQVKDDEMYDVFTVDLMKKPGKGLGLSIVGRRNDVGVYISDVVSLVKTHFVYLYLFLTMPIHNSYFHKLKEVIFGKMFKLVFYLFVICHR